MLGMVEIKKNHTDTTTMTEEETIKLAEKILIAHCSTEWSGNTDTDKLTEIALEQAESFRDAVNKLQAKEEPQQTP